MDRRDPRLLPGHDLPGTSGTCFLEAGPSKSFTDSVSSARGTPRSGGKKKLSMRKLSVEATTDLPLNDDCSELNEEKERSMAEHEKSMNRSSNRHEDEPDLSFATTMSKEQMQEHMSRCLQLSTENKINTKNAFALKLIDYMSIITKTDDKSNFAAMACQLDAGAKIYSSRVDAVHQQVIKLVDTCTFAHKKNSQEDGDPMSDNDETEEQEKEKKKKPKKKVIATSEQVSRKPKESDPKDKFVKLEALPGDILNKAKYCSEDLSLTLDRNMPFWMDWQNYKPVKPEGDNDLLVSDVADIESSSQSQELHPSAEEDCDLDLSSLAQVEPILAIPDLPTSEEDTEDMDFDADLSSSPDEDFPDNEDSSPDMEILSQAMSKMKMEGSNVPSTNDVIKTLFHNPGESDYHYLKLDTSNFWAGPSYWKRPQGHLAEKQKRIMKKKREPVEVKYVETNFEKLMKPRKSGKVTSIKRASNLSQRTMDKWNTKKVTLPQYVEFDPNNFLTVFNLNIVASSVTEDPQEQKEEKKGNEETENIEKDNDSCHDMFEDNDDEPLSEESSPEFRGFPSSPVTSSVGEQPDFRGFPSPSESSPLDSEHEFKGFDSQETEVQGTDSMTLDSNTGASSSTPCDVYEGENLVPMVKTVKVDPIRIVAKPNRVDMQHLKRVMLEIIRRSIEDQENKMREEGLSSPRGSVAFKEVLTQLFGSDRLHRRTKDDLTVQMAFLCLLTLTNENNFSLSKDDSGDFLISMTADV